MKNKEKVDKRKRPVKEILNPDIFTITDLSYDERVLEIKKRLESPNYKNSEYKCNQCYKGFLDSEAFKLHMARHSDACGTYQCDICKIRFKKQHALRNHTSSHMQKFMCKQCPYVTTRRHAAKLHEDYHNGTRYHCPHCQESFGKISTYMSHLRIKHPSDFVCELCGHSFVSDKGLALHKKLKHRFDDRTIPEDGPSCAECDVNFICRDALENHLRVSSRHNDNSPNPRKRVRKTYEKEDSDKIEGEKKKRRGNKPEGPIACEQVVYTGSF
ncbi:hypothetical protein O3G_MSEX015275 [Manduca sexta]|uniref:C2H2-type domain-containing protein n=1 Tax=Manduca sexta TaxID=7130 RepID=A0A921ZXY6_MANSE|nr:hypothetical protein O3G_MSEX015275 [Manduca sexta]